MVSAPARRKQVAHAVKHWQMSARQGCRLLGLARSTRHYVGCRASLDAPLLAKMRRIAAKHPRYGYRMVARVLARRGTIMSLDKAFRLWRVGGLQVPKKKRIRRPDRVEPRAHAPSAPNEVWAIDFVFDSCVNGNQLKCLTVVDEWTRECLAIHVSASMRASHVVDVLNRLIATRKAPTYLRSDNGPEFVAQALTSWKTRNSVHSAFSEPGKPWQNGTNESFNGRFRDECLNSESFQSRTYAIAVIEKWRCGYNQRRPHSSLNGLTPNEFRRNYTESDIKQ